MRDGFPEDVKRVVAQRVALRCSRPTCRAQTGGPQSDPTKVMNLGVAAHITAASPGGARYNPSLSTEERRHASNAIWLCQNCAKLVDNDPIQFPVSCLLQWKAEAEAEANALIGKTARTVADRPADSLALYERIQVCPAIPREFERETYLVSEIKEESIVVSTRRHLVPISKGSIAKVISYSGEKPTTVILDGRFQWITTRQTWEVLPEKPTAGNSGQYGLSKEVDFNYPLQSGLNAKFQVRWARPDNIPRYIQAGWHIFYDDYGFFLRLSKEGLVLMSIHP